MRPLIVTLSAILLALAMTIGGILAADVPAVTPVPPPYLFGGHYIPPQP